MIIWNKSFYTLYTGIMNFKYILFYKNIVVQLPDSIMKNQLNNVPINGFVYYTCKNIMVQLPYVYL